jgi:hypothetical protein
MLVISSTFATLQFTSDSLSLSLFSSKSLKEFKEFDTSCLFDPRTNPSELAAASKVGSSKVLKEEVCGLYLCLKKSPGFYVLSTSLPYPTSLGLKLLHSVYWLSQAKLTHHSMFY